MESTDFKLFENKKIILCVSGGVDSMVLLHTAFKNKQVYNIDVSVCHFEHGIRGQESKEDMDFVVDACRQMDIPVFVKREDIPSLCGGVNVEETARNRRYAFFYDVLKKEQADYLVLAHHKNDNCETVLMNIIRGCGMSGLCGMPLLRGNIARPFLRYTKEQLREYAKENSIAYREDSTNRDTVYLRNLLRNELIPLMEKQNPNIINSIDKMRVIIDGENDFLQEYTAMLPWIIRQVYGYDIKVEELKNSHPAIKRRSIYFVLKTMAGRDFDSAVIENILDLAKKPAGKKVEAGDLTVYRQKHFLCFVKRDTSVFKECQLNIPGTTQTPFGEFKVEYVHGLKDEDMKKAPKNQAYFSLDSCPVFIRSRIPGDSVLCFKGGHKKLKDIFIDKKVPVFLRDRVPVLWDKRDILFVPGVIRSNKYPFSQHGIKVKYISKYELVEK